MQLTFWRLLHVTSYISYLQELFRVGARCSVPARTCPAYKLPVDVSSGYMMPTSTTSYRFLEWHDAILSPTVVLLSVWMAGMGECYLPFRTTPFCMLKSEITPRYLSYEESNSIAFRGPSDEAVGGGMRSMIAFRMDSTPRPVLADIWSTSDGSMSKVELICAIIRSGSAAGRSILKLG